MDEFNLHTEPAPTAENPLELIFRGLSGVMHQQYTEKQALLRRCEDLEAQTNILPATPIVAEGKQKKLLAILNAIFESRYIDGISKKEFMQRAAEMFGCPGLADYTRALYNVKNTYGYDDIFTELAEVAHKELIKND